MRFYRPLAALLLAATIPYGVGSQEAPQQSFSAEDLAGLQLMSEVDPMLRQALAIVNGDVITDTDIDQRLNLVLAANSGNISEGERPRLRMQIMRNLIDEKLQLQEAASNDIKINEAEVDRSYERVAQNFKKSSAEFEAYLRQAGSSPTAIKSQIRGELAWSRVLRRKVEPLVNVGDDEVQAVIAKLNAAKGKDEFHVGEIFLPATPETEAQVMNDAARIVGQVRQGASFVAYARQFSEASSAGVGGDLGWVRTEQLNDTVAPVVMSLTAGDPARAVSDPVRVPGGVAIMTLLGKRQVLASDPLEAILSLKQISLPLPANTTEAQAREMVTKFKTETASMGGCGGAERVAQAINAQVAINDSIRLKDLPAQLQTLMSNMSIGQATPPFGSQQEGLRVLVLCGRDESEAQVKAPSFDEIYAQMNDERVNMRARRYLRDLRRDAIVDYR